MKMRGGAKVKKANGALKCECTPYAPHSLFKWLFSGLSPALHVASAAASQPLRSSAVADMSQVCRSPYKGVARIGLIR
jgi:hypothetical protein